MTITESNVIEIENNQLANLQSQLEVYESKIDGLILYARNYQVISNWSAEEALGIAKDAKDLFNRLEDTRKVITEEPRKFVNRVNDSVKVFTEKLKEVETTIKNKIAMWNSILEKKAKEQEEEAKALAEGLGIDVVPYVNKSAAKIRTDGATSYEVERHKFTVEDLSIVPREFLMVDEDKVKLSIKMGTRDIPGLKIYSEKQVIIKSR